jgi:hypothetical protein
MIVKIYRKRDKTKRVGEGRRRELTLARIIVGYNENFREKNQKKRKKCKNRTRT